MGETTGNTLDQIAGLPHGRHVTRDGGNDMTRSHSRSASRRRISAASRSRWPLEPNRNMCAFEGACEQSIAVTVGGMG